MTCNLRTVKNLYGPYELNGPLTLSCGPWRPLWTVRTEINPSKKIRTKQRNILSVDNDIQFTDSKVCLTDRQKPIRTVRTEFNPSKNVRAKQCNILNVDNDIQFTDCKLCHTDRQKPIRTVRTEQTVNPFLRTVKTFTDRTNWIQPSQAH